MLPLLARKLPCRLFSLIHCVSHILILSFVHSGDEEEPAVNVTAPMSTSQTLALSETHHTAEETSPPQQNLQTSTPVANPRAPRQRGRGLNLARSKT
jgi:hypothetical protein